MSEPSRELRRALSNVHEEWSPADSRRVIDAVGAHDRHQRRIRLVGLALLAAGTASAAPIIAARRAPEPIAALTTPEPAHLRPGRVRRVLSFPSPAPLPVLPPSSAPQTLASRATVEPRQDLIWTGSTGDVTARLAVSSDVQPLRGVLVLTESVPDRFEELLREACRNFGFAKLQLSSASRGRGGRSKRLADAVPVTLREIAARSGRPDMAGLPLLFVRVSASAGWSLDVPERMPHRAIAFAVIAPRLPAPERARLPSVPALFIEAAGLDDAAPALLPFIEDVIRARLAQSDDGSLLPPRGGRRGPLRIALSAATNPARTVFAGRDAPDPGQRWLVVDPDDELVLGIAGSEPPAGARVEYREGERVRATATEPPFTVTLSDLGEGAHALHAVWFDQSGHSASAAPVLVLVRRAP